jgi:hypothetical protein
VTEPLLRLPGKPPHANDTATTTKAPARQRHSHHHESPRTPTTQPPPRKPPPRSTGWASLRSSSLVPRSCGAFVVRAGSSGAAPFSPAHRTATAGHTPPQPTGAAALTVVRAAARVPRAMPARGRLAATREPARADRSVGGLQRDSTYIPHSTHKAPPPACGVARAPPRTGPRVYKRGGDQRRRDLSATAGRTRRERGTPARGQSCRLSALCPTAAAVSRPGIPRGAGAPGYRRRRHRSRPAPATAP